MGLYSFLQNFIIPGLILKKNASEMRYIRRSRLRNMHFRLINVFWYEYTDPLRKIRWVSKMIPWVSKFDTLGIINDTCIFIFSDLSPSLGNRFARNIAAENKHLNICENIFTIRQIYLIKLNNKIEVLYDKNGI